MKALFALQAAQERNPSGTGPFKFDASRFTDDIRQVRSRFHQYRPLLSVRCTSPEHTQQLNSITTMIGDRGGEGRDDECDDDDDDDRECRRFWGFVSKLFPTVETVCELSSHPSVVPDPELIQDLYARLTVFRFKHKQANETWATVRDGMESIAEWDTQTELFKSIRTAARIEVGLGKIRLPPGFEQSFYILGRKFGYLLQLEQDELIV